MVLQQLDLMVLQQLDLMVLILFIGYFSTLKEARNKKLKMLNEV